MVAGCNDPPIGSTPPPPCTTNVVTAKLQQSSIDKIDILLAIDNSRSMADKQELLALAVPDLVKKIINPRCIDDNGEASAVQPTGPLERCPDGTHREIDPILDIHIGVISTSIGGHGADSCPDVDNDSKECQPKPNTTNNDKGHLISRLDPCTLNSAPTYAGKGFLVWDPELTLNPPGESVLDDSMGHGLLPTVRDMVRGVGQIGCGYESQLESIYRFLVDPNPYETITVDNYKAIPNGTDEVLLAQRAAFLRPDSLLSVILLTDENDCSIKEYGQFYYVGQLRNGATNVRMPRARQECAVNVNDPCCKSCGQGQAECPVDPTCADPNGGSGPALLTDTEDNINLRCWDQKRRFGIDFLYPTDRYVQGFSSATIADRDGQLVPNPIFSDLDPLDDNSNIRDPGLVFFTGIVGVPWQDIARDKTDPKKGFKTADELAAPSDPNNPSSPSGWEVILGDLTQKAKPLDPLMLETYQKRTGTNPITGDMLADSILNPGANPINGHEWTIPNDDLQYACIFPLLPGTERDCTNTNLPACDCTSGVNDNPLCKPDPNNMNKSTLQVKAKAYPGIRPLQVIRELGAQGVVGSVCAPQVSDPAEMATDFGYRPAMEAVGDRLKTALGGQCLPTQLTPEPDGRVACEIIEARNSHGNCSCNPMKARRDIVPGSPIAQGVEQLKQDPLAQPSKWDCFCEIPQLLGDELAACQNDTNDYPVVQGSEIAGWCYVDANGASPVGNPDIVAKCPENEKRIIRFVGDSDVRNGATLYVVCQAEASNCNP